jgi:hypothetical protein
MLPKIVPSSAVAPGQHWCTGGHYGNRRCWCKPSYSRTQAGEEDPVPVSQRQLAASLRACTHIADREAIAGFLRDPATQASINPFPQTSAGAQRTTWSGHSFEFRVSRTHSLGLSCLLRALAALPGDEALVQEIYWSGPYRAYLYHRGDGCQVIGAVLHGRGAMALPAVAIPAPRRVTRRRPPTHAQQLDLFAFSGQG